MGTSRPRDDRGVSAIEFSVVVPIVLLLIFLTIQAGFWMYGRNSAQSAAREGVSYLRLAGEHVDPESFKLQAEKYAYGYATKIGGLDGVEVDSDIDAETGKVTMTVSGSMDAPAGTWTVTQTVTATLEKFRPDAGYGDGD
ncbi:TadE/TadG family type IV pilus assembly protein [Solicola gregarius]|uniref:Pilus assembly protein n=1 Tax=Solicola gregarius TaxID=2908642 RepID=A0AA46YJU3_9ACTN|nr:TadE/TadG family type IV pilus assembly protein [Solicola gregarius]UYM04950.1 pilus assembly protein [Solicola gregarius]